MNAHAPLRAENTKMFLEAGEASTVVARQLLENTLLMKKLGQRLRAFGPRAVVTCARGSSDHAATYAKYMIETKVGLLVSSAAPSVTSVYTARQMLEGTLFLGFPNPAKARTWCARPRRPRTRGHWLWRW